MKELLDVGILGIRQRSMTVICCRSILSCLSCTCAVRPDRLIGQAAIKAHDVCQAGWHIRQIHWVERVTIPFVELGRLSTQAQYLIAAGRLKNPDQRLSVETIGYDQQLLYRTLKLENFKFAG